MRTTPAIPLVTNLKDKVGIARRHYPCVESCRHSTCPVLGRAAYDRACGLSGSAVVAPKSSISWSRRRSWVASCRSTDGTSSTSTGSRPIGDTSGHNGGVSVRFPSSGRTITGNIWRRIPTGIARITRAGSPSKPRSYKWGEGVVERLTWFPSGSRGVTDLMCVFCGKTRDVFCVEVYRKSTGDSDLGKSAAKELRSSFAPAEVPLRVNRAL